MAAETRMEQDVIGRSRRGPMVVVVPGLETGGANPKGLESVSSTDATVNGGSSAEIARDRYPDLSLPYWLRVSPPRNHSVMPLDEYCARPLQRSLDLGTE